MRAKIKDDKEEKQDPQGPTIASLVSMKHRGPFTPRSYCQGIKIDHRRQYRRSSDRPRSQRAGMYFNPTEAS